MAHASVGGFTLLLVPGADGPADLVRAQELAGAMRADYGEWVLSVLVTGDRHPAFDEDHTVADRLGELAQQYEISHGEARAILVRPDMYIGAHCRLDEATALVGHLAQWLTPKAPL
ncbi:hypothetical protein [Amycolatopsis panacis]|uniref:Uncharacterized protein n=1 Tax=Amycolatopsis panacis TaxID=2340917 RepID=A0A419HJX9_9PSEU|nr:hypothetical protein [Amycolatopsis panacis]RJQ76102.1 hypothetical protein D5S19_30780 [Amycolatopsis panacis]